MKKWIPLSCALLVHTLTYAAGTTPTDFTATYQSVSALKKSLEKNGLKVLGTHQVAGQKEYTTVIYTAPELQKVAALPERGFAGIMRILVDEKAHQLVASNPEYYLRAFLQKEYKDGLAQPLLDRLEKAFGKLTPTEDSLKTKKLEKYNFMMGMPKYGSFQQVAKAESSKVLCEKLEARAKDRIVFKLKLNDEGSSVLYGVALPKEIEQFNETLNTMGHCQLLPYTVWINKGKAQILHAKYYLALSFPRLSMKEFMKIMSVPGDIKEQFQSDFE